VHRAARRPNVTDHTAQTGAGADRQGCAMISRTLGGTPSGSAPAAPGLVADRTSGPWRRRASPRTFPTRSATSSTPCRSRIRPQLTVGRTARPSDGRPFSSSSPEDRPTNACANRSSRRSDRAARPRHQRFAAGVRPDFAPQRRGRAVCLHPRTRDACCRSSADRWPGCSPRPIIDRLGANHVARPTRREHGVLPCGTYHGRLEPDAPPRSPRRAAWRSRARTLSRPAGTHGAVAGAGMACRQEFGAFDRRIRVCEPAGGAETVSNSKSPAHVAS